MVRNLKSKGTRVEISGFRLVEHAYHRVNGLSHSVELLEIGDDGRTSLGLRLAIGHHGAWNHALRIGEVSVEQSVIPNEVCLPESWRVAEAIRLACLAMTLNNEGPCRTGSD